LQRTSDGVVLTIRDDGVGGADPRRGTGLVGLTDRVHALDGSLRVISRSGEGTQITVDLPIEESAREPEPRAATAAAPESRRP
jgi:signal transduction histidine kinase